MKTYLFILLLLISTTYTFSQSPDVHGLYVNGFDDILGNPQKEDSLLRYAGSCNYNYLILYDLYPIHVANSLTNVTTSAPLANFIRRAKENHNIQKVGAAGENYFFFETIIQPYNSIHPDPIEKFDVFNIEFEFWNVVAADYYCTTYLTPSGLSCDTAGGFTYFRNLMHQVDSLGDAHGTMSEVYLGWFNQGQAVTIGNEIDRILLHDYISNYSARYSYLQQRLQHLASRNIITEVIPIFSAEPVFMGPWLVNNSPSQGFADLQTDLIAETGTWKQYINLNGYQWFAYSFMPDSIPIANAGSDVTICAGDSVSLSASGGVTYSWSPASGLSDISISNPVASPDSTYYYTVTVSRLGCDAYDTVNVQVDSCVVAGNFNHENYSVHISPNPFSQELIIESGYSERMELYLYSIDGKLLVSGERNFEFNKIDTSDLPQGVYILHLRFQQQILTRKLVKI